MYGAELRGEQRLIKSRWTRGSPIPETGSLELPGVGRGRTRRAASTGDRVFSCHRKLGLAAGKAKGRRNEKAVKGPRPRPQVTVSPSELNVAAREALGPQARVRRGGGRSRLQRERRRGRRPNCLHLGKDFISYK